MPAALRRGLVAFHLDDLAVAHGYPNAALHLAASAAARANALDFPRIGIDALGKRPHRLGDRRERRSGTGDRHRLHEAAARERELSH